MKQYIVTGMSCAACSARVEKAVNQIPGVESCSVSLLTNSMGVEGDANSADVIKAVTEAGYGCSLKENGAEKKKTDYSAQEEMLKDKETPLLKKRLFTSLGFLIVLMYLFNEFKIRICEKGSALNITVLQNRNIELLYFPLECSQ